MVLSDIEWGFFKGSIRLLILTLLEGSPMHGYQILKRVEKFIGSRPKLSTVYTILAELERKGLVKSNSGFKRYYSLTDKGKKLLHEIRKRNEDRMKRLVSTILEGYKG